MDKLFISLIIFFSLNCGAHESLDGQKSDTLLLKKINKTYLKNIKILFERVCFDCHAGKKNKPWYYSLPIAKNMIDEDIKEALTHIDFRSDFPFRGHDTPLNDLIAIKNSIKDNTMPPLLYSLSHQGEKLSSKEREIINKWLNQSIRELEK